MVKTKSARSRGKGMTKTDLLLRVEALEIENAGLRETVSSNLRIFNNLILVTSGKKTIFNCRKKLKRVENILLKL